MLKIRLVITKNTGEEDEKYPVVLFYNYHNGFYVTTVFGEEAMPVTTIHDTDFDEHVNSIQDFLATLGTASDYAIMENEVVENLIARLID